MRFSKFRKLTIVFLHGEAVEISEGQKFQHLKITCTFLKFPRYYNFLIGLFETPQKLHSRDPHRAFFENFQSKNVRKPDFRGRKYGRKMGPMEKLKALFDGSNLAKESFFGV